MAWKHYTGTTGNDVVDADELLENDNVTDPYQEIQLRYDADAGDDRFDGTTAFIDRYYIYGNAGDDILKASSANGGRIEGGDGDDEIFASGNGGFHIDAGDGSDDIEVIANGWNYVLPGLGSDTIVGSNSFINHNGDLVLSYHNVNSVGIKVVIEDDRTGTVEGYVGGVVDATTLDDTFVYANTFEGTANDDYFLSNIGEGSSRHVAFDTSAGDDTYEGGSGWEHLAYNIWDGGNAYPNNYTQGISVHGDGTVTDQWGDTDTLINIDFIEGTNFDDGFVASASSYHFAGKDGEDDFTGMTSEDWEFFDPGAGDDVADFIDGKGTLNYSRWGGLQQVNFNKLTLDVDWNETGSVTLPDSSNTVINYDGKAVFSDDIHGEIGVVYFDARANEDTVYLVGFTGANDVDIASNFNKLVFDFWDNAGFYRQEYTLDWDNKSFVADELLVNANPDVLLVDDLDDVDVDPSDRNLEVRIEGTNDSNIIDTRGALLRSEIYGYDGDDIIYAVSSSGASDEQDQTRVSDGDGDDEVYAISVSGGEGVDIVVGAGDDIYVGSGDTTHERLIFASWAKDEQIKNDGTFAERESVTVRFLGEDFGRIIDDGWGGVDEFSNYQRITGSDEDDSLIGNIGYQSLDGRDGDDFIDGGEGHDNLRGSDGNDEIYGGAGDDHIDGGADDDEIFGGSGNDWLLPGGGNDEIHGGDGDNDAADYWISALDGQGRHVEVTFDDTSDEYAFRTDEGVLLGSAYFESGTLKVKGIDGPISDIDTIHDDVEGLSVDWDGGQIWYDIDFANEKLVGENYSRPSDGKVVIEGTPNNDVMNIADMMRDMNYDPLDRNIDVKIYSYEGDDIVNMDGVNAHIEIYDDLGDDEYNSSNPDNTIQINETGGGLDVYNISRNLELEPDVDLDGEDYQSDDFTFKYDGSAAPQLVNLSPDLDKPFEIWADGKIQASFYWNNGKFTLREFNDDGTTFGKSQFLFDDRGHKFVRADFFDTGGYGAKLFIDVDNDSETLSYIYTLDGTTNEIVGGDANDYFYDTHLNELFRTGNGNDYVELWDGGSDTVYLGAGDDEIWPDGWFFQHAKDGDTPNTLDTIHGEGGFDTIYIDTWGGHPEQGEYLIDLLSATETTETFRIFSTNSPEEDFKLVLNKDGSGDAYYNYAPYNGHKFLTFTGIERVEFNNLHQTLDQGDQYLKWARFDIDSANISASEARDFLDRPGESFAFNGHNYYLLRGDFTFDEAVTKAEALGGHILEIDSDAENEFILDILETNDLWGVMLGINDADHEGIWLTHDDKFIEYEDWPDREPNDWGGGEDFAVLDLGNFLNNSWDRGGWNDIGFWGQDDPRAPVIIEVDNGNRGTRLDPTFTELANYTSVASDIAVIGSAADQALYGLDNKDDFIHGGGGDDDIRGLAGHDVLSGGSGDDSVRGGAGDDKIYGEAGNDTLRGDAGRDTIMGRDGADTIYGGDDGDDLYGHSGNDTIYGEAGSDRIFPGAGSDTVNGGADWDDIQFELSVPDPEIRYDSAGEYELWSGSNLIGQASFNDAGTSGGLKLTGFEGLSSDVDRIYNVEALTIKTRTDNGDHFDTYIIDYAQKTLTFLEPDPHVEIPEGETDVNVRSKLLEMGYDPNDIYLEPMVRGNDADNIIDARDVAGRSYIEGFDGDDIIYANGPHASDDNDIDQTQVVDGAGDDIVYGTPSQYGVGIDVVVGSGNDKFYASGDGRWGAERINFREADEGPRTQNVSLEYTTPTSGIIHNDGYGGRDEFFNFGRVTGSERTDVLIGNDGRQTLWGRGGNDRIEGKGGNDDLQGEDGNDTIYGGSGDDYIEGGDGNDFLDGGEGWDHARWYAGSELADVTWNYTGSQYEFFSDGDKIGQVRFVSDGRSDDGYALEVKVFTPNGTFTDTVLNTEQVSISWHDFNDNWRDLKFDVNYADRKLLQRDIRIEGTDEDDVINVAEVLESRGYDPRNWDLDVELYTYGGDDYVDLSGVNAYVEVYDDEGDDEYYAPGETGRIRVREEGEGGDIYFGSNIEFELNVDFNESERDIDARSISFSKLEGRSHSVTEANPLTLYIDDGSNKFASTDFFFNEVGDFVWRDYFTDDRGNITGFEDNILEEVRDYRAIRADLYGNGGPDGRVQIDINYDKQVIDYIYSLDGRVNIVDGTDGDDYLFDSRFDEDFDAGDGDDYIQLWDGGNDVVYAGAGDDEIWPDGWYFQNEGDNLTYDFIDGQDGYDAIHIDTWGGNPRPGEYFVDLIESQSDADTKVYRIFDRDDERQDFNLVLNDDGSGSAYYNYYGGHKFLDFENIERIEFNNTRQTLERGPENLRWAGFDIDATTGDITAYSAREAFSTPVETYLYAGHTYMLFDVHMDFDAAVEFAENQGGYLVEVDSLGESNFIYETILSDGHTDRVMLGITDREYEGIWLTEDGRYISFNDWNGSQPDDYNEGQDYATAILGQFTVDNSDIGGWDDRGPDGWVLVEKGPQDQGEPVAYLDSTNVTVSSTSGYVATIGTGEVNQTFTGSASDDIINAGGGRDTIRAGAGDDRIIGGTGNDTLYGEDGNDFISGADDSDTIDGGAGDDRINGGNGNDTITGGSGSDDIRGGYGNDTISVNDGEHDWVSGGIGSDTITGDQRDVVYYEAFFDDPNVESEILKLNPYSENGKLWLSFDDYEDGNDPVMYFSGSRLFVSEPSSYQDVRDGVETNFVDTLIGVGRIEAQLRSMDYDTLARLYIDLDYQNKSFDVDIDFEVRGDLEFRVDPHPSAPNISVYDSLVGNGFDPNNPDLDIEVIGDDRDNLLTAWSVAPDGTETTERDVYSRVEFYGGAGDDTIRGGLSSDHIDAGSGDDFIYAEEDLGKGDFVLPGTGQDNIIGNKELWFESDGGTDLSYTNLDHLDLGITVHVADDGQGYSYTNDHTNPNLTPHDQHSAPTGVDSWDEFLYVDYVQGTNDDDVFLLPDNHQFGLRPRGGDDTITGATGNGYSWVGYRENDAPNGIIVNFSGSTNTVSTSDFSALSSNLSLSAQSAGEGIIIDPWGDTDTATDLMSVRGTDHRDIFFGSNEEEHYRGYDGDDIFYMADGDDWIDDGFGNDFVDGGTGVDTVWREFRDVDRWQLDNITIDTPYGSPTNMIKTYLADGRLSAKYYFNSDGDFVFERGIGRDSYEINVFDDVEFLDLRYWDLNGDYIRKYVFEIDQANEEVTISLGREEAPAASGFQGYKNTDDEDDYTGSDYVFDTADYRDAPAAVTVDTSELSVTEDGFGNVDTFSSVEQFILSDYDDSFTGRDTPEHENGTIYTQFISWMPSSLKIGYEVVQAGPGDDNLDGAGGYDELSFWGADTGINIDLTDTAVSDGYGDTDTISNFEGVEGTSHNDTIYGTSGDNSLDGVLGNDTVDGRGGTDILEFNGYQRYDLVADISGGTASYKHDGNSYTTSFTNIEGIVGTGGDDDITGNSASNYLIGLDGDDILRGKGGDDHLYGGAGEDRLEGGAGNDTYYYFYENGAITEISDSGGAYDEVIVTTRSSDGEPFWSQRMYFDGADLVLESRRADGTELTIENATEIEAITWRTPDGRWGEIDPYDGSGSYTLLLKEHDATNLSTNSAYMLVGTNAAETIEVDTTVKQIEVYAGGGNDELTFSGGNMASAAWATGGDGNDRYFSFDAGVDDKEANLVTVSDDLGDEFYHSNGYGRMSIYDGHGEDTAILYWNDPDDGSYISQDPLRVGNDLVILNKDGEETFVYHDAFDEGVRGLEWVNFYNPYLDDYYFNDNGTPKAFNLAKDNYVTDDGAYFGYMMVGTNDDETLTHDTTNIHGDIYANGGDDVIELGAFSAWAFGGSGDDEIYFGTGQQNAYGGDGEDKFIGTKAEWLDKTIHDIELGDVISVEFTAGGKPKVTDVTLVADSGDASQYILTIKGTEITSTEINGAEGLDFSPLIVQNANGGYSVELKAVESLGTPGTLTDTNSAANSIAEGSASGATVGLTANAGSGYTYSLSDDANGRFGINSTSGVVTLIDPLLLDFELSGTHTVEVQAVDSNGLAIYDEFDISVTDLADEPFNFIQIEKVGNKATFGAILNSDIAALGTNLESFSAEILFDPIKMTYVDGSAETILDDAQGFTVASTSAVDGSSSDNVLSISNISYGNIPDMDLGTEPVFTFEVTLRGNPEVVGFSTTTENTNIDFVDLSNISIDVPTFEAFNYSKSGVTGSAVSARSGTAFDGTDPRYGLLEGIVIESSASEGIFVRATNLGDTNEFEIVALPSAAVSSFGVTVSSEAIITNFDETQAITDFADTLMPNQIDDNTVAIAGLSLTNSLNANTEIVLATFSTSGSGSISVSDATLGDTAVANSTLTIKTAEYSDQNGFVIDVQSGANAQLVPYASYEQSGSNPITPSDALEVLKTVVRINQSPTIEQMIAGDVDMDGKLTPSDALSILKNVVRMDGGVTPEWIFIDQSEDYSSSSSTSIGFSNVIDLGLVSAGVDLSFEGVLLGDWDGSL